MGLRGFADGDGKFESLLVDLFGSHKPVNPQKILAINNTLHGYAYEKIILQRIIFNILKTTKRLKCIVLVNTHPTSFISNSPQVGLCFDTWYCQVHASTQDLKAINSESFSSLTSIEQFPSISKCISDTVGCYLHDPLCNNMSWL